MARKTYNSPQFQEETELDWLLQPLPRTPSHTALAVVATVVSGVACLLVGYIAFDNPVLGLTVLPLAALSAFIVVERCFEGEPTPASARPQRTRKHHRLAH